MPPLRKRLRQRAAFSGMTPNSAAIALPCHPSALPQLLVIDFGNRHVEACPQAVLEPLDVVTLVFERVRLVEPQFERDDADGGHGPNRRLSQRLAGDAFGGERLNDVAGLD